MKVNDYMNQQYYTYQKSTITKPQPMWQFFSESAQHFSHSLYKHDKEKSGHGGVQKDDEDADPQCVGVTACIDEEEPQRDRGKQRDQTQRLDAVDEVRCKWGHLQIERVGDHNDDIGQHQLQHR